mmetsp:Transcript_64787/g.211130  ORF Transcript_64787/g.211130 Transcript_64787/m.211130 type:complete len:91 (-) Transcript_64787:236-508(-)
MAPHRPAPDAIITRLEAAWALQEAARQAPRQRICVICMDAEVDAKLRPCSHAALCRGCASVCVGRGERCPICRTHVTGFVTGDFEQTFAC